MLAVLTPFAAIVLASAPLAAGEASGETAVPTVSGRDFYDSRFYNRTVRISGVIRDAFDDEIDSDYVFFLVDCDTDSVYVACHRSCLATQDLGRLVGASVTACGYCGSARFSSRGQVGRQLSVETPGAIRIEPNPGYDPFAAPEITPSVPTRPSELARMDRRRLCGSVLAIWGGDKLLLASSQDTRTSLHRITLAQGTLPHVGDHVEVVGFPETDLFRINLNRAVWRKTKPLNLSPAPVLPISVASLYTNQLGRSGLNLHYFGNPVRIVGKVLSLPDRLANDGRFFLRDESGIAQIDVSANPEAVDGVDVGATVEVTGICVLDAETWRPNASFSTARGFFIVPQSPADIRLLARPPWWTPGRVFVLVAVLILLLLGIVIWNRALHVLVERRGRQLLREEIGSLEAQLRVRERTNLAVELHDTLSQTLTGVALQIQAARDQLAENDAAGVRTRLDVAGRSLTSCRRELRNCMRELRSEALDAASVDEAIRLTLAPHLEGTRLSVRFNVPRGKLSDNTLHALLRIIRELSVNAIYHGRAAQLRIAGSIEPDRLLFSVRDDGCGFDPAAAPGVSEGHFGLQGILERVRTLGGTVQIESAPGKGAKVTVCLALPHFNGKEP